MIKSDIYTQNFIISLCKELIIELKFISKIPENHKPCFNSFTTIDKSSWFVTIKRRLSGEKGESGVKRVNDILNSCDSIYRMCNQINTKIKLTEQEYLEFEDSLNLLVDNLSLSLNGLNNLVETYKDQKHISNSYINMISRVKNLINDLCEFLYNYLIEIGKNTVYIKSEEEDEYNYNDNYEYWYNEGLKYECDDDEYYEDNILNTDSLIKQGYDLLTSLLVGSSQEYDRNKYIGYENCYDEGLIERDDENIEQRKIINILMETSDNSFFNTDKVNMVNTPE